MFIATIFSIFFYTRAQEFAADTVLTALQASKPYSGSSGKKKKKFIM